MTQEVQLVLIGGLIGLASSIGITVATAVLNHWLEGRREKRRLRVQLLQMMGHNSIHLGGQQDFSGEQLDKIFEDAKARALQSKTLGDMAFDLGVANALAETFELQEEVMKSRSQKAASPDSSIG